MRFRVSHTTTYAYSAPCSVSHTELHLTPHDGANQKTLEHDLLIEPRPDVSATRIDYFGNAATYFLIQEPHQSLTIIARSRVEVEVTAPLHPALTPPWEQVRDEVRRHGTDEAFDAFQFVLESPRVTLGSAFADYAARSFKRGRPLLEAVNDLSHRINRDFEYEPRATTVATPVDQVLESRQGVCQDFAHLMIAALRSTGLPARYVSGYLRSAEKTVGAEASHAWVSVFCQGFGWLDFDPTNDLMPCGEHVTIARGRDYSDVPPVKGVAVGGGAQTVEVGVEVVPESPSVN
jgi:transglutaminase-like putative cysteine protease